METESVHTLESQVCFALYSAMHAVGRTYAPMLDELGLTYPQYLVMLVLWEGDDLSVTTIGKRLFLDSGTLTPLLKRLEAGRWLERHRHSADERQVRIRLTQAGRDLRERALALPMNMACAMGRPVENLVALRDDLLRLRSTLLAALDDGRSRHTDDAPIG